VAVHLGELTSEPGTPRKRRARLGGYGAAAIVLALLVAVRLFVAEPMRVPTGSMQPTLRPGDHVLLAKLAGVERGDLVVFEQPAGGLFLKRVVGVAGDEVGLEDGALVVNGRTVNEPYVNLKVLDGVYFGPVTVPPGRVFVMGDNRADSVDSRTFGPVPLDAVAGQVTFRLWPRPGRL
jgi:signal peptidase I